MQKQYLTKLLPDALVIVFCLISIGLSTIESRVNTYALEWGLMYANAADVLNGLVPYRETFTPYGILTTLIQSLSLIILGNNVVSVGIITGIFYGLNIYLCYCLWQKIMNRWLSCCSALLMFLVHPYIIFPWSNYFSYTFLLISLLFLLSSFETKNKYLLSGFFLAFSFLARQSPLPLLVPFYLYFCFVYFSSLKELRISYLKHIVMFHLGMTIILGFFFLYIISASALNDWIKQSFTIIKFYQLYLGEAKDRVPFFLRALAFGAGYPKPRDARLILYSLSFFNALIIWGRVIITTIKGRKLHCLEQDKTLFLFTSITLLGYLQAFHFYDIFRLQSSSSLGLGLLLLSLYHFAVKFKQWKLLIFWIPTVCLAIYLSRTLVFHNTSSVYFPWNRHLLLSGQLKEPVNIKILKGKLLDEKTVLFYETLTNKINDYSCNFSYLVNLSKNSYIPKLSDSFKTVQRSPWFIKEQSDIVFPDEQEKIDQLIREEKALIIARHPDQIPQNYQIVLHLQAPDTSFFVGSPYIAVPKNHALPCSAEKSKER